MIGRAIWMLVAGGIGLSLAGCSRDDERPSIFPRASSLVSLGKLPASWGMTALADGKEVSVADLRGKVLFINRWATWCGPCVAEMPSIQALYESLKDSEVVFLLITEEKSADVKTFLKQKGWSLPVYLASDGIPPILRGRPDGIPATFVVNRKGEVVFQHVGGEDWNTPAARQFLKSIP